jgi:hypothetical protein
MPQARYWETSDELMTVSVCSEGCLHLRIGRTIIKLTQNEFFALTKLANTATHDMQFSELAVSSRAQNGH